MGFHKLRHSNQVELLDHDIEFCKLLSQMMVITEVVLHDILENHILSL